MSENRNIETEERDQYGAHSYDQFLQMFECKLEGHDHEHDESLKNAPIEMFEKVTTPRDQKKQTNEKHQYHTEQGQMNQTNQQVGTTVQEQFASQSQSVQQKQTASQLQTVQQQQTAPQSQTVQQKQMAPQSQSFQQQQSQQNRAPQNYYSQSSIRNSYEAPKKNNKQNQTNTSQAVLAIIVVILLMIIIGAAQ